jgi:dihydrofolate synthase / folylpolyglutamate synthase
MPGSALRARNVRLASGGCWFDADGVSIACPLAGEHQVENARTAFAALTALGVPAPAAVQGIGTVRWPGRLELVSRHPDIILDGAHNPAGAHALAKHIRAFYADREVWLVYGTMQDKAVEQITALLFPLAARVILTAPAMPRAVPPENLLALGHAREMEVAPGILSALRAVRKAPDEAAIFITGSLYLVGEARAVLVQ